MQNRRLLINAAPQAPQGMSVTVLVVDDDTLDPIPGCGVFVDGISTQISATTAGGAKVYGFSEDNVDKAYTLYIADLKGETHLPTEQVVFFSGVENETWMIRLMPASDGVNCYLLNKNTLAPIPNVEVAVMMAFTEGGIAYQTTNWEGLAAFGRMALETGAYWFETIDPYIGWLRSNPFMISTVGPAKALRYILAEPPDPEPEPEPPPPPDPDPIPTPGLEKYMTVGKSGIYYGYSDGTEGGTYGNITPNPITISGRSAQIRALYMTNQSSLNIYMRWDHMGPSPTRATFNIGSFAIDVALVDWFDDFHMYENTSDREKLSLIHQALVANVDNTIKCEITFVTFVE